MPSQILEILNRCRLLVSNGKYGLDWLLTSVLTHQSGTTLTVLLGRRYQKTIRIQVPHPV